MNESEPEIDWMRRMAAGETAALGEFYDCHAGRLFALALRILNDPKEAEDTIQEVFLQMWEKAASYDVASGRPLAWVITMTRNRSIDRLRSAQRRARLIDEALAECGGDLPVPSPDLSRQTTHADETEIVRRALEQLPHDQRQAIDLAFFSGLTQTEIATSLQVPLGTVKARIRRGMLKLRDELGPFFDKSFKAATPATLSPLSS